jgi:hypothetical protein
MSGLIHSLLVLAGLRAPRRAPSARLRGRGPTPTGTKPAAAKAGSTKPRRPQAPKGGKQQQSSRPQAGNAPQPRRTPSPTGAQRRPAPRQTAPQRTTHEALDDVFSDLDGPLPPEPARKAAPSSARRPAAPRRAPPPARKPSRQRNVSGFSMFFLASLCLGLGGWAGSMMQAYAYGPVREAATAAEMREFNPQAGFRF